MLFFKVVLQKGYRDCGSSSTAPPERRQARFIVPTQPTNDIAESKRKKGQEHKTTFFNAPPQAFETAVWPAIVLWREPVRPASAAAWRYPANKNSWVWPAFSL